MRTLEEWFKYLEQQYVDEQERQPKRSEKPQARESTAPAEKVAEVPKPAVSVEVTPQEAKAERPAMPLQSIPIPQVEVPDPAQYIATLRRRAEAREQEQGAVADEQPEENPQESQNAFAPPEEGEHQPPARRASTRRAPYTRSVNPVPPPQSIEELWKRIPKHVRLLIEMGDDEVTQKYYDRRFKESRRELVERLLNPSLTLEDTARLLGVCPTTVRRYTERGLLNHYRTPGNQRRFRLSDVIAFLEARQQAQEMRRRKR